MAESDGVPPGRQTGETGTGKKVGVFDRPAGQGLSKRLIAIIAIVVAIVIILAIYLNR